MDREFFLSKFMPPKMYKHPLITIDFESTLVSSIGGKCVWVAVFKLIDVTYEFVLVDINRWNIQ